MSNECKHDDPNMCGCRSRNHNGLMRTVRNDKTAAHIEKQYNVNVPGRSDQKLKTLMKKFEVPSQNQLIKKLRNK